MTWTNSAQAPSISICATQMIALKWNYSRRRGVCRPRVMHVIADFLMRTATEKALILGSQVTVEAMLI